MKKIIVPTDFSEVAVNAFHFAQQLNKVKNGLLQVVHVYHPSFEVDNPYLSIDFGKFEATKRASLERFTEKYTLPNKTGDDQNTIQAKLSIGFAAEEIVKASAEASLVVMGTTGQGDALEKVFGTVSTHVARKAHCPVLLVPLQSTFTGFRSVLFASNDLPEDEDLLRKALDFTIPGIETLHMVHVDETRAATYEMLEVDKEQILRPHLPEINLKLARIGCQRIWSGLDQYAADHAIDLMVMGTIHRGFLKKLFHQSQTKGMILHAQRPLLVLHY